MTALATAVRAEPVAAPRRRLLVCSAGVPHPTRGASTVLFWHYIARLSTAGWHIRHVLLLEGDAWSDLAVEEYRAGIDAPGRFEVVAVRSPRLVEQGRFAHALDAAAAAAVRASAAGFAPDAIVAFDILAAWALSDVPGRRLVWLGDLNFETIPLHARYAAREDVRKALHLPSVWLAGRTWRRVYRDVLSGAEQIVVAAGSSRAALATLGLASEYEPYPWPEAEDAVGSATAPGERPTFLFFGTLTGLGSRSALHFTIDELYPHLVRLWGAGGFRILFAGRGELPGWAGAALAAKPEIERLGFVDDLGKVMRSCHAVLVPIEAPVGNRSRILTALAHRAPVIAHANTALGNPDLVDGVTCWLGADAASFAERMRRAVTDQATASQIAERGRRLWRERFHPEPAGARLVARVAALLGETVTR